MLTRYAFKYYFMYELIINFIDKAHLLGSGATTICICREFQISFQRFLLVRINRNNVSRRARTICILRTRILSTATVINTSFQPFLLLRINRNNVTRRARTICILRTRILSTTIINETSFNVPCKCHRFLESRINGNVTIAGNSQWRIDNSGWLCSLCCLSRGGASSKQRASQCGCAQGIKMSFLHSCFSPIKLKELKHSASILKNAFRIRFSLLS